MEDVEFTLSKYQDHLINGDDRMVAIIAGKGSGKTWAATRYVMREVTQQRGQGLVMFNTIQQARDIFFQDFEPLLRELNWPYSFNQQTMILHLFDSIIHFRSAEPSALERIESVQYHWGWADEASFYSPKALETFVSRIRKGGKRIRITSMPAEPDAFMYDFIETLVGKLGGKMYELGLMDNPDKDFVDSYRAILESTYSGAQLERFLYGKRVSLSGTGIFATDTSQKSDEVQWMRDRDVMLSWDFNVEFRAVSAWQQIGVAADGNQVIGCVKSWKLTNPTVFEDAIQLVDELRNHKALIYLHGDASGENRSAQATGSMWKTIRDYFNENLDNIRYIVPKSNPPVKDTIQCVNWALRQGLVLFNANEKDVFNSLSACKADKYGEIDKSMDYTETSSVRSHHADTARYAIFHYYKHIYPGNRGGFFVV